MASTSTQQVLAPPLSSPIQPTARQRWVDLGLVLFIGFAPLVFRAAYALLFPIQGTESFTNYRLIGGLLHELSVLALFLCLLSRQGRGLKDIGAGFHWTDVPKAIGLTLLALFAFYFCVIMVRSWSYYFTGGPSHLRSSQAIFSGASTGLFLIYLIAAPIFEETLVRGYLMTELIGLSCPVWLAALCSFVLQAGYHLYYGFAGAILVSAIFAVFAIYFARSRKLMPVLLAHLFWNLGVFFLHGRH